MSIAAPAKDRSFPLFVAGIALTQMLGWGTTFYLPSILDRPIGRDLGVGREVIYGGISVMLVVAAVIAPRCGKWIDSDGARNPMMIGKVLLALGLVGIGLSTGPLTYLAAWVFIGLGMPMSLSIGALASVTQSFPERGRHGLRALMLFGGLSNGVIWPLTGWLEAEIGWRAVCFVYAGVQTLLCLPLAHALIRKQDQAASLDKDIAPAVQGLLEARQRSKGFWLLVIAAGISGLVSWGLPLYFVAMFLQAGMDLSMAIFLASFTAYFTFVARLTDFMLARHVSGMRIVAGASLFPPVVFGMMLWAFGDTASAAAQIIMIGAAMALYGAATGLIATSRAILPLELFGPGGYAATLGKLSRWLNLMFAASPLLFAILYDGLGKVMTLWIAMLAALVAAIAYWQLDRLVTNGRSG
ncbi:MAG: MFS transporter [Hyphomicrobiales bacterium]|jgi:predicted MFS family arabinose efflux permease|nr:MFS transporter [Hyphomicrobiales bacterium]